MTKQKAKSKDTRHSHYEMKMFTLGVKRTTAKLICSIRLLYLTSSRHTEVINLEDTNRFASEHIEYLDILTSKLCEIVATNSTSQALQSLRFTQAPLPSSFCRGLGRLLLLKKNNINK